MTFTAVGLTSVTRASSAPAEADVPRNIETRVSAPGSRFSLGSSGGGITSLRYQGDVHDTDYVMAGQKLGVACARIRTGAGEWQKLTTDSGEILNGGETTLAAISRLDDVSLTSRLALKDDYMQLQVSVVNEGQVAVEVGDLYLPMPMNTTFRAGHGVTESVFKHSIVNGHGSFAFWMRGNSVGPYLMLLPERDTHLEYWNVEASAKGRKPSWQVYILAGAASAETKKLGTNWRQPTSTLILQPGEAKQYNFRFIWVKDYQAAREAIAKAGLLDVEITPGMTVPSDLHVDVALRSEDRIERIEAEYPDQTDIETLPSAHGRSLWRIRFKRLGENRLTVHQAGGRRTYLEFFATEPVETLMKKRAAFIVRRQHRDASKWYNGLFGEWNAETGTLLGPDNYDRIKGWRIYEVTCDDPGLSKPAYLAAKNAEHPVASEIEALDLYIEKFVWGGLQQTTSEAYPYGIYGIPDWKQNRESPDTGNKGRLHIWRPYDYPHIFLMYFSMYKVARDHPAMPTRLSAREYLVRASGTALGMFTIPDKITGWGAYNTGFYNECIIPELIEELRTVGMTEEASALQGHWARKVQAFVDPKADLFGSEYPFDSTGFESTQALARSALDAPDSMGVSLPAATAFSQRQIEANVFCRGWLEPAYYYLGSDYRGRAGDSFTLTYMAQMGGWALLDYALNDAKDPHALLRLGYASQLSAWALLSTGTQETNYGYWYPGEQNDGASAGGFEPAPSGETWLDQPHHRGPWYYSCESDLGFCGAVRAAATIVADDPVFGRVCHGGSLSLGSDQMKVVPRDGIRRRLNLRLDGGSVDIVVRNARFRAERPILIDLKKRRIRFEAEPYSNGAAEIIVEVRNSDKKWRRISLRLNGKNVTIEDISI